MSVGFAIGFSIVAFLLSAAAVGLGAWGIVEILSFKRSTHNIQYVPMDEVTGVGEEFSADDAGYRKMMEKANAEFMQPPMQNEVL